MDQSLYTLLKGGGYILYVRHGEATVGEDLLNINFYDCLTQRNLSVHGKEQAIYYGQLIRYYQIPIRYPIHTSPFCRAIETAQLAFGNVDIIVDPYWYDIYKLGGNISSVAKERTLSLLPSMLEKKPPFGSNRIIIAHSFPEGIGLGPVPEMGTVIIKPLGQGNGYEIVRKLSLLDLANLTSH